MAPRADRPPPIAVAVVSYEERDLLAACLRSLQPDVDAGRAEVWVVDNASTDGSPEMVREEFPWASLLALEDNLGYGAAVNAVARRSESPWLIASNQDVEVLPGAVERMLQAAGPEAGAVAPRLVLADGSTQHSVHSFPSLRLALFANAGLRRLAPAAAERLCLEGSWDPDRAREVPWAIGAFLLLRREALDAVGGFDPDQWMYTEDLDLGWRLARAGWRTLYEPRAEVRHVGGASAAKAFGDGHELRWMSESYRWMQRRLGRARALAIGLLNVVGSFVQGLVLRSRDRRRWAGIHVSALRAAGRGRRGSRSP